MRGGISTHSRLDETGVEVLDRVGSIGICAQNVLVGRERKQVDALSVLVFRVSLHCSISTKAKSGYSKSSVDGCGSRNNKLVCASHLLSGNDNAVRGRFP